MDVMQIPDLMIVTQYLDFAEAAAWAQTRQVMLCSLKPYLKKKNITADEFFPLPIDDNYYNETEHTTEADPRMIEWFKNIKEKIKESSE